MKIKYCLNLIAISICLFQFSPIQADSDQQRIEPLLDAINQLKAKMDRFVYKEFKFPKNSDGINIKSSAPQHVESYVYDDSCSLLSVDLPTTFKGRNLIWSDTGEQGRDDYLNYGVNKNGMRFFRVWLYNNNAQDIWVKETNFKALFYCGDSSNP